MWDGKYSIGWGPHIGPFRSETAIAALSSGQSNLHPPIGRRHRQLDDHHRNPNINDRDHLVGQLTMLGVAASWFHKGQLQLFQLTVSTLNSFTLQPFNFLIVRFNCFQSFEHWLHSLYDLVHPFQKGILAGQLEMERNIR